MLNKLKSRLTKFDKFATSFFSVHHYSTEETSKKAKEYTHFGNETVKTKEKSKKVHEIFSRVASKYDVMNDVMSVGIHRVWKDQFIRILNPDKKTKLLDAAGGTGDIAFRFANYVQSSNPKVTVCDVNNDMLNVGKERAQNQKLDIKWICCNADKLPFPESTFNAFTIAFGIRNCTHIDKVLQEAYRVLSPGGRFLCLEFSDVPNPILKKIYDEYSNQVIPIMGEVIAGDWKSYQYLVQSIRKFPNQTSFVKMIEKAGFNEVSYHNLTFGICAVHSGFKL